MSYLAPGGPGGGNNPSFQDLSFERRSSVNVGVAGSAVPQRGRRRSTVGTVLMNTETVKERQVSMQISMELS